VLVPSVNRTVAWVPPGGWRTVALRDQIVVIRSTHELRWYRDDALVRSWRVTLGARATPTPLGRTFILGTSLLNGYVYADTKVFALGSVPDDVDAIPPGLRGAHIGIHTWYHDNDLGRNTSDGCIRLTRKGQRLLLDELVSGTPVVVVDRLDPAA
jgi:lipoprotein-anchoring transpeptidase ErfK/SrfK